MKTIKQLEQEIEYRKEGCGNDINIYEGKECGDKYKTKQGYLLCAKCKSELQELQTTLKQTKEIAEMIERMIVASNDTGKELNSESAILTGKDLDIIVRSILNEILSKINGKEKE